MRVVHKWALATMVGVVCAACSNGTNNTPAATTTAPPAAAPTVTNNSIVMQLSRPDEAAAALGKVAAPGAWKAQLDTSTAVSSSDKLKVSAAIGMQAANGIVAEYADDDADAQKLATSVKGLADRLSLGSAALEQLVATTASDAKQPDAGTRSADVRRDLVSIQDQLKSTLDEMGDGPSATMMLFGAWVEGVRMAAGVLQTKYDAAASGVLNRRPEADYFLAAFSAMPANASPIYAQLVPPLKRMRDAMTPDASHQISRASVGTVQSAAAELAGLLKK